jgi:protein SCO1
MKKLIVASAVLLLAVFAAAAQSPAPAKSAQSPAEKYFTDTELINQDGKTVRFYTDVLQGKVIVINSFFSTCQGACLPMNRNFQKVAELLGDHVGKDLFLVSITVDPEMDTPGALKAYAKRLNAPAGWMFLTGTRQNVDLVLKKLGQYVEDKNDHMTIMIIGNERTGLWKKAFGLAQPDELVKVVESVLNDKPGT